MFFLYIPYLYFLKTRIAGRLQALSWFFVYFFPVIIFWFVYEGASVWYLVLSYYAINLVYENGYIQNDVLTTKREENPTLRLSDKDLDYARLNIVKIFIVRTVVLAWCLYLLFLGVSSQSFLIFVLLICLLQVLFFIYNNCRGRINLYMIVPLSSLRFYGPMLPVMIFVDDYISIFSLLFLYPVPKFLEFTMQPRYRLKRLSRMIGNVDRFRVVYYCISSSIFLTLYLYGFVDSLFVCIVALFYFFYRSVGYVLIIKNARLRSAVVIGAKEDYRK